MPPSSLPPPHQERTTEGPSKIWKSRFPMSKEKAKHQRPPPPTSAEPLPTRRPRRPRLPRPRRPRLPRPRRPWPRLPLQRERQAQVLFYPPFPHLQDSSLTTPSFTFPMCQRGISRIHLFNFSGRGEAAADGGAPPTTPRRLLSGQGLGLGGRSQQRPLRPGDPCCLSREETPRLAPSFTLIYVSLINVSHVLKRHPLV